MRITLITCLFTLFSWTLWAQDLNPILHYPALNSDGSSLAFSYQGDIWTVDANGGVARRLTIHESYESRPQWSLDDAYLLFQGNRFGNYDIFTMDAAGSQPNRITYHSTNDAEARWGKDGSILFTTRRLFAQVEREGEIFQGSLRGGTPTRLLDAVGLMAAPSPDGRYVAFIRGTCRIEREAYTGPANRDIWIYDTKTDTYQQLTTNMAQDIYPDWGDGNTLYFLSARNNARYNVFMQKIQDGKADGEPVAMTFYKDEGIRYFDISADGSRLVYEHGTDFYIKSSTGKDKARRLEIDVTGDYRFDPVEEKTFSSDVSDYAVSPNGKYIALEIRGELFLTMEDKDRKRSVRLTDHPFRDQNPQWLNDSTLLFLSDRSGNQELYMLRSADSDETNLFKTLRREIVQLSSTPTDETAIYMAPDRKQLAIRQGRGKLMVAEIDAQGQLSGERVLLDGWGTPSGISWSPDSKWLAYGLDDLNFNQEIYIHAADGSKDPVNVSMHPRNDASPVWSADGSKLGFLSIRNNGDSDVWFVWLKESDWEKTRRDWEEEEEEPKKDKDKKNGKSDSTQTVEPIVIDFKDIHERLQQVTRLPGNEGDLAISKDGETFYFSTNGGGRASGGGKQSFMSVKWDGSEEKTLLEDKPIRSLSWGQDYKYIYLLDGRGTISKLPAGNGKLESIPFTASMTLDYETELVQIFEDAWRALRDGFYDPEFHGQDWEDLKEKYKPRALREATKQDFRAMFNEMLGQLDASHMGLYGSNPEETQRQVTGLLGVELETVANGMEVTYVLADSPADRSSSKLNAGDVITAVNGESAGGSQNIYELLNGQVNERTLLEVNNADGESRDVIIRPTGSLRSENYDAWVQMRKDLTEKYSDGRLGYIHIQGMNWPSFERFERELQASGLGKEGIVIDVRYNGGGWTTDMLMAVLNVRQHAYTIPRGAAPSLNEHPKFTEYYPYGERLPLSAWTKPSVALCNENSYSNAEIFSHAYKTLDHGTLVGQPTFGAVISTGGHSLLDGSYVRMPFRAWYVKATMENMEHGPAMPDVLVENEPDSKADGEDPQLNKAVDLLLNQIDGKE